jgi:hypothetical protein
MTYCVDVALNGQQYTGKPVNFRFYDVQIDKIEPECGPQSGGTNLLVQGKGLYEAVIRRIRFTTADKSGSREVNADWDRNTKSFKVTVPPF